MVNPGFFKRYLSSVGEENMKIPNFSESIQRSWPTTLTLRDRYSNLWPVNLGLVRGTWFLRDGWTRFIKDNFIKDGDVIIFEYSSRSLLDFKVLGSNGCMTRGVGCRQQVTEVNDDVAQELNQERTHKKGRRVRSTPTCNGGASTSNPSSSRNYDWFGTELIRSGRIRQPENHYFVTKKRKERPYELYVPMEVIKGIGLQLPEKTLFHDPEGRKFPAVRKIWRDGRTFYTGGWEALCKTNMVGDEDFCICEFVRRRQDQDLVFHVSFLRLNVQ